MAPPPPPPPPPPIQGADPGAADGSPVVQPTAAEIGLDGRHNSGEGPVAPTDGAKGEKTMTLSEVRKQSCNWSMASDAGLLLYLQEFSQKMIARTSELEKMVDGIVNEAKSTESKVHNTLNDFLMIANTQFVENRVYDDSEEMDMHNEAEANPEKKEVTEVDLIPKVSKALNLGINVIDTAFDTLDANAGNSDSEDDDTSYRHEPILEPKDPYSHRPLPHIIGSRLFMEEDDVGLVDYTSEVDEDLSVTGSSVTDSEEESDLSESEYSESGTESDLEEGDVGESASDAEENDLFNDSEDDYENGPLSSQKPFTSELEAKILGAEGKDHGRDRTASKISSTSEKDKKKKESERKEKRRKRTSTKSSIKTEEDDPFAIHSPPDEDDVFSGGKGLFSGGKGLFDDDDAAEDDGGLFDEKPSDTPEPIPQVEEKPKETKPRARTRSGRKVPVGGVSMFGAAAADELFGPTTKDEENENEDDEEKQENRKQSSAETKEAGGLFDEDGDNDGDLFADAPPKKEPVKPTKSSGLFSGDEEDELFGESAEQKPAPQKKKLPAGAVSMFGTVDPLAGMKGRAASTEEEPESPKRVEPIKKPEVKEQKSGGLFDDDDDLFAIPSVSSKKESPQVSRNSSKLFDDDDDGLFTVPKEDPAKQSAVSKKPASSMFDDNEEDDAGDDLFAAAAKPKDAGKKKKPVGGVAIFGDEDLFSKMSPKDGLKVEGTEKETKTPEEPEPVPVRENPTPRKNTFSLFYEEDEKDDEELFPSSSASSSSSGTPMRGNTDKEKIQRRRTKSKSVFDDEDVLFGSREEEAPQVDLFSATSPSSPPKPAPKKSQTAAIFDDDDDDDLFGEKTLPKEDINKVTSSKAPPIEDQSQNLFADNTDADLFNSGKLTAPQVRTKPPKIGPKSQNQHMKEPSRPPPRPVRTKVGNASPPLVKVRPKTNDKRSSNLFGDNEDDDLFNSKDKKMAESPVKSSKPVFGAVDPLNAGKGSDKDADSLDTVSISSSVSSERPTANGISAPKHGDPLFGSPIEDDDLFSSKSSTSSKHGFKSVKPPGVKSVKAPSKPSNVAKIQANVSIQPNKLKPGAAPVKDQTKTPIMLDLPAEANTLPSLNKNRAKVCSRRRPPSRHRKDATVNNTEPPPPAVDTSNDMDFASAYQPLPDIDPIHTSETYESYEGMMGSKPAYAKVQIGSKSSNDMSSIDDLLADGDVDPLSRSPPPFPDDDDAPAKPSISKNQLIEDDPLFSSSNPTAYIKNSANHVEDDDLFAESAKVGKPVAKPRSNLNDNDSSPSNVKEKKVKLVTNDDDDLFSSTNSKIAEKRKQIASKIEVDEDLFSSPSKTAATPDDPFGEDLFSSTDKPRMRETEDELFTSSKKENKRPKSKTVRADDDLFGDTTDIFADIPSSKSKEKKTKKKTDDIFADTSSMKPKQTKSKKKTDRKSRSTSIFNSDAPSIFDDPLNATQQE